MDLREILAIAGAPGLYKYVAQGKGGIIVEALADGKRTLVNGSARVSALGDIAMFTFAEEVALNDVFTTIYKNQNGNKVEITGKSSPAELADFMTMALPNYDTDRVHNSDIKKLAQWYNILVGAGMTDFSIEEDEESAETPANAVAEASDKNDEQASTEEKAAPKKRKTATKTATPKATDAAVKSAPKASGAKVANKTATVRKSGK